MKDAFGAPQSLLLLGGTSRIGLATARRLIARRTRTVWLAGRPSPGRESAAAELHALGAYVRTVDFDALDTESHETALGKIFTEGDIDMVLLAFGILGDQERDEEEPLSAVRVAQTNYTGAVSMRPGVQPAHSRSRGTDRWWCCPRWRASGPGAPTSSTDRARRDWTRSPRDWATPCTAPGCM